MELEPEEEPRVPVLLIRTPAVDGPIKQSGGWDLLLPRSWSMVFWTSFVRSGAKVAGMMEWQSVFFERGTLCYPQSFPDSQAGRQFALDERKLAMEIHEKKPPGKRPNYIFSVIHDPFICQWENLVSHWQKLSGLPSCERVYVLRCRKLLRRLQAYIDPNNVHTSSSIQCDLHTSYECIAAEHPEALVAVSVRSVGKGSLSAMTSIHLPPGEAISSITAPRRMICAEKCGDDNANDGARPLIGYLHTAAFSLSVGSCAGQGFVSLTALAALMARTQCERNIVCVRTPASQCYRFAKFTVLTDLLN